MIEPLISKYPDDCRPDRVESLGGAGGFSGATFWRMATARGTLCFRRWPPQSDPRWPARLPSIHALLEHVARHTAIPLPAPIRTRQGATFVEHAGRLWELSAWLPGRADYFPLRRPEKLRAALTMLAQFHRAAAEFRGEFSEGEFFAGESTSLAGGIRVGPSPGIRRRREQIDRLRSGGLQKIVAAIDAGQESLRGIDQEIWNRLHDSACRLLPSYAKSEDRIWRELVAAERVQAIPLQTCIRDIWHDHVLFQEDYVSGVVDFGAMRVDNVACDVARLLGSFSQGGAGVWHEGLAAYEAVRPLSADERQLLEVFDRSTTLLAGIELAGMDFRRTTGFRGFSSGSRAAGTPCFRFAASLDFAAANCHHAASVYIMLTGMGAFADSGGSLEMLKPNVGEPRIVTRLGNGRRALAILALLATAGFVGFAARPAPAQSARFDGSPPICCADGLGDAFDESAGDLTVHASILPASGDKPAQLAIAADIPAGWHTYSITQPAGGPNRTQIKLAPSDEYSSPANSSRRSAPQGTYRTTRFPACRKKSTAGHVTWTAPLTFRQGVDLSRLKISGSIVRTALLDRLLGAEGI